MFIAFIGFIGKLGNQSLHPVLIRTVKKFLENVRVKPSEDMLMAGPVQGDLGSETITVGQSMGARGIPPKGPMFSVMKSSRVNFSFMLKEIGADGGVLLGFKSKVEPSISTRHELMADDPDDLVFKPEQSTALRNLCQLANFQRVINIPEPNGSGFSIIFNGVGFDCGQEEQEQAVIKATREALIVF